MPYSKKHKQATRKKILESAVTLFSNKGFSQVSIDDLMHHAGLTRGAFYTHFASKQDVYAKSIIAGVKARVTNQQTVKGYSQEAWMKDLLFSYLSEEHVAQKDAPCPLAFLVTDIANKEEKVKATYTRMYKMLNKTIQAQLSKEPSSPNPSQQEVYAATAMMIGGVAIARALNNEAMEKELLESCRHAASALVGCS